MPLSIRKGIEMLTSTHVVSHLSFYTPLNAIYNALFGSVADFPKRLHLDDLGLERKQCDFSNSITTDIHV